MGKIIGIDLGTTNSVVSVMEGSEPKVIPNDQGGRTTPSIVAFTNKGERLVGGRAKNQRVANPKNTIYSVKRFMGRRASEVSEEREIVPYEVSGSGDSSVSIKAGGSTYTPPQISAMTLQYLKKAAEDYLGETVTEAVITVPAYFNDAQRQATKDAGEIAGLKVRRIVNEPTAASLAYATSRDKNSTVAVFDLGGGTFDISILDLSSESEGKTVAVESTNGDTHLGGDDFDEVLINYVADEFQKEKGVDLRKDVLALQRLKEACEKAKIELSSCDSTQVNLPYITVVDGVPQMLNIELTRAKFEHLVSHLVKRIEEPCLKALKDAGMTKEDIDEVLLVGGSTRIPIVQKKVEEIFGRTPNKSVNPDEAVALGAAVQGSILSGDNKDLLLIDVTPLSLGLETAGNIMAFMVERNTAIPYSKTQIFTTASPNQPAVDIKVYQGERKISTGNRLLGNFSLQGIPPAPAGTPQIEVKFDIDANGILKVSAKDLGTGKEQKVVIQSSSGLSEAEIEKMRKDAEQHAAEDEQKLEEAKAKNDLERLVLSAEKLLSDSPPSLTDEQKEVLESIVSEGNSALSSGKGIKETIQALQSKLHEVSQNLYSQEAQHAQSQPEESEEDVIDADFTVKD